MNVDYEIGQLQTGADWKQLATLLGGESQRVVHSVIRHLITVRVKSYLCETRYIDRDYSSDYRAFYAQTFKDYNRHCRRIHFFAEDVEALVADPNWATRVDSLQKTSKRSYRGFCVVRPLSAAPIGRTMLHGEWSAGPGLEAVVTSRSKLRANLLGAELDVVGAAFMQQDSRVGACAQVAIWAGARHMHQRHGYDWFSVADITKLAAPSTADEAKSLPAGSDFLTSERMIRAISEMGFQPLCFDAPDIGQAILPYVESGLPVILGLQEAGSDLGHAVTIIGRVFASSSSPTSKTSDYVAAFIVHDDQAGPYMLVPRNAAAVGKFNLDKNQIVSHRVGSKTVEFNLEKHAVFAVVLMPIRVFSTAREAERTSLRRFEAVMKDLPKIRHQVKRRGGPVNDRLLDELADAYKRKNIIFRTYLTSASGYRRHIAYGTASDALKDVLMHMHLPHFTWVTEISTHGSYNQASAGMRRMYGHSVLDATSTGKETAGLLMLHIPGLVFIRDVNAGRERGIAIENDTLYECREKRIDH